MSEAADDTGLETSDAEVVLNGDDYEADFVKRMSKQFEEEETVRPEGEEPDEDAEQEEPEDEEAESDDESEDDAEEDEDKISIRVNGKKADISEVLDKTVHTVKIDGEESEVAYDELIKGYQRGADYARKTTDLKKEREDIQPYIQMVAHAKEDPQFVQYVQSYFKNGPFPEAANNPLLKVTDDQLADMLDMESSNYNAEQASQVVKARKEWRTHAQERDQVAQRTQAEAQRQYQSWVKGEIEKARDLIESQGGSYEEDGKDVLTHLADIGFSDQEINSLADARMTLIAWEAAQYRKLKNSQDAPKARIGAKRQKLSPPRAMAKGGTQKSSKKQQRNTYRRAVQTQKTDDWVSAIASRLR